MKNLVLVLSLAAVIGISTWFFLKSDADAYKTAPPPVLTDSSKGSGEVKPRDPSQRQAERVRESGESAIPQSEASSGEDLASPPAPQGDSDRISNIIGNEALDFDEVVAQLVDLLPDLGEDDQVEAAHHIVNLLDDDAVVEFAPLLIDNRLPAPALEVIYPDLLNRPHPVGMPILAAIADQPENPIKEDAIATLEFLYGNPPAQTTWQAWVERKLAE